MAASNKHQPCRFSSCSPASRASQLASPQQGRGYKRTIQPGCPYKRVTQLNSQLLHGLWFTGIPPWASVFLATLAPRQSSEEVNLRLKSKATVFREIQVTGAIRSETLCNDIWDWTWYLQPLQQISLPSRQEICNAMVLPAVCYQREGSRQRWCQTLFCSSLGTLITKAPSPSQHLFLLFPTSCSLNELQRRNPCNKTRSTSQTRV